MKSSSYENSSSVIEDSRSRLQPRVLRSKSQHGHDTSTFTCFLVHLTHTTCFVRQLSGATFFRLILKQQTLQTNIIKTKL